MVTGRVTLLVALVDVNPGDREVLRQACLAAGYSPILKAVGNPRVDRLGRRADVVLVGADLSFRALHWAERARGAGMATVGVLLNWWSDLEWDARQAADFVLHTPLTPDEALTALDSDVLRTAPGARGAWLVSDGSRDEEPPGVTDFVALL